MRDYGTLKYAKSESLNDLLRFSMALDMIPEYIKLTEEQKRRIIDSYPIEYNDPSDRKWLENNVGDGANKLITGYIKNDLIL